MRNSVAVALILLASMLAGEHIAQFPLGSANFSSAALPASEAGIGYVYSPEGSISFRGHYGDYIVTISRTEKSLFVSVAGKEEGMNALASEIRLLEGSGVLSASCPALQMLSFSQQHLICIEGKWQACPGAFGCELPSAAQKQAPVQPFRVLPLLSEETQAKRDAFEKTAGAGSGQEKVQEAEEGWLRLAVVFGAIILMAAAAYLFLHQRQAQVEIDSQTLKLLENQTRIGILRELSEADRIPTDLSIKLSKSKATIVEHLEALVEAGLVEKMEQQGKKFVFYRLTRKGRVALLKRAG
ncbi:MAG: winged helix-turn-helix domain-containing protein [Candidatus Micrarchaeota archaeon]|nr:winged helix-turn-helix domain-containing protein [Candidatus Micrarchaeota archaeon]